MRPLLNMTESDEYMLHLMSLFIAIVLIVGTICYTKPEPKLEQEPTHIIYRSTRQTKDTEPNQSNSNDQNPTKCWRGCGNLVCTEVMCYSEPYETSKYWTMNKK